MTALSLVKRTRQLEKLKNYYSKAKSSNTPQISFVVGEAGSGKSTLVFSFLHELATSEENLIVAYGDCNSYIGYADPYLPFREVLGMLIGDVDAKQAQGKISEDNVQALRQFGRASLDTLIEFAPDLIGTLVPGGVLIGRIVKTLAEKSKVTELLDKRSGDKAQANFEVNQSTIFHEYTVFLEKLSQKQMIVIVLEDLHWADNPSINLLFHLLRTIKVGKLYIIGTYRPDDVSSGRDGERHPLESTLNEIKRIAGDVWVNLDEITENDKREFVNQMVDREPNKLDSEFRNRLFLLTEGNALFVSELMNDMKERDDLVQDAGGNWIEGPFLDWTRLPTRVEAVIEERVARLEDELKESLSIASIEGELFTAQVMGTLQSVTERDLFKNLSGLLEKKYRMVAESGERLVGETALALFRFNHSFFQQYIYNDLGASQRRILHKQVAEALEALYEGHTNEIAAQLARHFDEANQRTKASTYYLTAGNNGLTSCAYEEAIILYKKALNLAPDDVIRININRQLGNAYYGLGDLENAREFFETSIKLAESQNDSMTISLCKSNLGRTLVDLGDFDSAKSHLDDALKIAQSLGEKSLIVRALNDLGYVAYALEDLDKSERLGRQSMALALEMKDSRLSSRSMYDLACTLHLLGNFDEASDLLERALELARNLGDKSLSGYCLNELGWTIFEQENYDLAFAKFSEGLSLAKDVGNQWVECESVNGLGFCASAKSEYKKAKSLLDSSLRISLRLAAITEGLLVLVGYSHLFSAQGNVDKAANLIGLILNHESSDAEIKHFARLSRDSMQKSIDEETLQTAIQKGAELDYEEVSRTILNQTYLTFGASTVTF